jgi:outer membrane protein OmpA-like peptidoglycan-associated protein
MEQPQPQPIVVEEQQRQEIPMLGEELVTRDEFINMMMAMRAELKAINERLDALQAAAGEKTVIKVQQIPLEPKQHVMEEVFEVRFDFDKSAIKPEYQDLIRQLATATQANKNIKVSVIGHTDTAGSNAYNYALGGRRAEAVQKMLIQYGIPASQIVAVSSGEEDLKVPTPDNTPNADNRRVRVVKETHYSESAEPQPVALEIQEYAEKECNGYGCE